MAKKLTSAKAKKILHDKTVHGKPLTDKQRKFFGAIAGGAEPYKAQNGIEGTMGGLTDIGFNYNGAWGGTMQLGGSLPGAVGFMYARTQGSAPSNGPYAKKTKASAQNGMEMKYYQAGLDFKPKTISQDGSIITPYGQWEYPGEVTTIPSNNITMEGVPYPVLGVSDTGETKMMYPGENYMFDGTYVTEYPMAAQGVSVNKADEAPLKKLDQLLNFTNYNDMAKAKKGKTLPKYQNSGRPLRANLQSPSFMKPIDLNRQTTLGYTPIGLPDSRFEDIVSPSIYDITGVDRYYGKPLDAKNSPQNSSSKSPKKGSTEGMLGGVQNIISGAAQWREDATNVKRAKQWGNISDLAVKAMATTERQKNRYVRPEDYVQSSNYGTGMDILASAEDGMQIGGNLTEIQNMYNPGDLYSDLGYEPMEDSSKVKQFQSGGGIFSNWKQDFIDLGAQDAGMLGGGIGSFVGGGSGQQSGASKTLSGVGQVAGTIIGGPLGGAVGSALGGIVGGVIGAGQEQKIKAQQQKINNFGLQQNVLGMQNRLSAYMKDGGGLKYLSHDWQPQVIAKFGDYDLKDLLAPPKDADMLRAGGEVRSIRSNYMGDDEKLSMMQMGGELQTYWGGDAETISENPYLPDGGETIMFRGQSHEESDGQGRTGIGITFGQNPVEVERGEPAVKLKDGGTGEDSLIVFGNMQIPSYGVSELGDDKAKGKKFKHYAADLSKVENKANKTSSKALEIIDDVDGDSPFDLLKLNTGKAMLQGADATLKEAAYKKNILAGVQSAILDTAKEQGLESDALAKGKIKQAKDSDMAKFGAKMETAQLGINQPLTPILPVNTYYRIDPRNTGLQTSETVKEAMKPKAPVTKATAKANTVKKSVPKQPEYTETRKELIRPIKIGNIPDVDTSYPKEISDEFLKTVTPPTMPGPAKTDKDKLGLDDLYNQLYPYIRPGVRNPLDPGQLAGEMYALATNQLEPVQAQTFTPLLEDVTSVSFQDQLNEIQAQANAAMRMTGNNPAAQAVIASQSAAAKNKVLAEQLRTNQALQMETRRRNLTTLNDATLKNLAILDQQYQRQETAKSKTKAQAFEALSSISDKIARNKAETLSANVMANMYPQYSFGPQGRIYSTGMTKFNIPTIADYSTDELQKIMDAKKAEEGKKKKTSRNGSIVKAIKNL